MRFQADYQARMNQQAEWEKSVEQQVANLLMYHVQRPLVIGNMVYDVISHNGRQVPAYAYLTDYKKEGAKALKPIYNRENEEYYGWTDFNECCAIYDVISNTIINKQV